MWISARVFDAEARVMILWSSSWWSSMIRLYYHIQHACCANLGPARSEERGGFEFESRSASALRVQWRPPELEQTREDCEFNWFAMCIHAWNAITLHWTMRNANRSLGTVWCGPHLFVNFHFSDWHRINIASPLIMLISATDNMPPVPGINLQITEIRHLQVTVSKMRRRRGLVSCRNDKIKRTLKTVKIKFTKGTGFIRWRNKGKVFTMNKLYASC